MKKVHEELNFSNHLRTVGQSGLQLKGSCLWIGLRHVLDKVWVTKKIFLTLRQCLLSFSLFLCNL